jgi:zinc transport system substrate-binding protein
MNFNINSLTRFLQNSGKLLLAMQRLGFICVLLLVSTESSADDKHSVKIFVSILPQKFFVEQVGGDKVEVNVMVGPGQSPETYEPSPRQMEKLSHTAIYFRMGMPFESVWIKRIKSLNPDLTIIDARDGIELRDMNQLDMLSSNSVHKGHGTGLKDPHIWTDPMNVTIFMRNFSNILQRRYPQYEKLFKQNYQRLASQLNDLDDNLKIIFKPVGKKYLLVFHPSWGYFAARYGLKQIPIEVEGKSPNAKSLTNIIEFAKQNNLHVVFTQQQFSQRGALAVATAIGGKVVAVDPLAEDYFSNMIYVAQQFAGSMQ